MELLFVVSNLFPDIKQFTCYGLLTGSKQRSSTLYMTDQCQDVYEPHTEPYVKPRARSKENSQGLAVDCPELMKAMMHIFYGLSYPMLLSLEVIVIKILISVTEVEASASC